MVDELVAEAKAAKRAKAAYERHMARIRVLLPVSAPRTEEVRPGGLEGMIFEVYERGTISRITAEAAGTSKKGQDTPKPPGGCPDGT